MSNIDYANTTTYNYYLTQQINIAHVMHGEQLQ